MFVGLWTAPPFLWPAVQTSKSTFHNRNRILHTEKKKTHRNFHQSRFLYSWGSRKERKMGQAEFPRTQFCHDHDMTENLMMAKDDAKSRKVSATYPSVTLSPLCQSKDAMLPCLLCHILPYFPLALFQGKRNRKGCARSLSLAKKTFGLMGAWTGAGDK